MDYNVHTHEVSEVIEMFTDATPRASTIHHRLITLELDSGNIGLIGYGEKILAEYDEAEDRVTVYLGHKAGGGKTVAKWLNAVTDEATSRRNVTLSDNAPAFAPPNADAAQYIDSYKNLFTQDSSVERRATETVIESLKWLDQFL